MNTFKPDEKLGSGAEHHVYRKRDQGGDRVLKVPALWSAWQDMSAETAQKDLEALAKYEIVHVPSRVTPQAILEDLDGTRKQVSYVLEQPFRPNTRPLTVGDLSNPAVGEQMEKMFEASQRLYRDTGAGVDYVGWRTLTGLVRSYPGGGKLDVAIHNVLLTDGATGPELELCDTRLFRENGFALPFRWLFMRSNNLQHEMIARVLQREGRAAEVASQEVVPRKVADWLYERVQNRL